MAGKVLKYQPHEIHEVDGQRGTLTALCRAMNRNHRTVWSRVFRLGWSVEEALRTPSEGRGVRPPARRPLVTRRSLARARGLSESTLRDRLVRGWELERALATRPIKPGRYQPDSEDGEGDIR